MQIILYIYTSTGCPPGNCTSITEQPDLNPTEGLPTRNDIAFFTVHVIYLSLFESAIFWCHNCQFYDDFNAFKAIYVRAPQGRTGLRKPYSKHNSTKNVIYTLKSFNNLVKTLKIIWIPFINNL